MLEKHENNLYGKNITACQESISAISASDNILIIFRKQTDIVPVPFCFM